jgi:hypothetical protein
LTLLARPEHHGDFSAAPPGGPERESVIKTNWDLTQFFFTRPISALLLVTTVLVLAFPLLRPVHGGHVRRGR